MPLAIDHLILAVTAEEHGPIVEKLSAAGFFAHPVGAPGNGESDDIVKGTGLVNQAVSFHGGGFIEVLHSTDTTGTHDMWFNETPRIQGVGFTTEKYDELVKPWEDMPDSWNARFVKTHPNDALDEFWAAGPLTHTGKFYPFVMKSVYPPYKGVEAEARLRTITFSGQRYQWWAEHISSWFGLLGSGNEWKTEADERIVFTDGPHEDIRLSVQFDVPGESSQIPLSFGTLELNGRN